MEGVAYEWKEWSLAWDGKGMGGGYSITFEFAVINCMHYHSELALFGKKERHSFIHS